MPIRQTKFIFCASCGNMIKAVNHGDLLQLKDSKKLLLKPEKYCNACKKAQRL